MLRTTLLAALAALVLLLPPRDAAAQYSVGVPYEGELIDAQLAPLSGVFALRFALYEPGDAAEPLWHEDRFVTVADGLYAVTLGRQTPLPPTLEGQALELAVLTRDGSEVARHPMVVAHQRLDGGEPPVVRHRTFADLTAYARRAERATRASDCSRLSGRTLAQIDQYDNVLRRLRELQQAMQPGGLRVSSETVAQPRVGGDTGNRYEVLCPPGFAVTGARGGAGHVLDGVQIMCTRVE